MQHCVVTLTEDLRVWQDERLGRRWRVAYREGDEEMVVSFPDVEALGDFIAERFGLALLEQPDPAPLAA